MIKRHILVVDDDEQTRTLLTFMLEQAGYVVRSVHDGYAAVEILEQYYFDLVVLDINMPFADGYSVAKTFPKIPGSEDVPILFVSGRDDAKSIKKAIESGGRDYIVKPVEKDTLINKVQRILGSRPQFFELLAEPGDRKFSSTVTYQGDAISISEAGMVVQLPIPLEIGSSIENLQVKALTDLEVNYPKLKVCDCTNEDGHYKIYLSFLEMSQIDVRKIREWVIESNLKNRNKSA